MSPTPASAPASQPEPPIRGARPFRVRPAPDIEPPYAPLPPPKEDADWWLEKPVPVQGTLALDFRLPSGLPVVPRPARRLRVVGRELRDAAAAAERPDACHWAALIAQAVIEVLAGDRPLTQLTRWTTAEVYEALGWQRRTLASTGATHPEPAKHRPLITSVHVCEPAEGVAEACVTIRRGERLTAVALRLEVARHGWCCTAVELG